MFQNTYYHITKEIKHGTVNHKKLDRKERKLIQAFPSRERKAIQPFCQTANSKLKKINWV